jgi:hypothetical protein
MQEQTEIRLYPPEPLIRSWYGPQSRDIVAALAAPLKGTPEEIPSAFFHYSPDGVPLNGMPMIRFGGGRGFFRIFAIGDEASDSLLRHANTLRRLVSRNYGGRPVKQHIIRSQCSIGASERWRQYRIHEMAVSIHQKKNERFFAMDEQQRLEFVRRKITSGIERQCAWLGAAADVGMVVIHDMGPAFAFPICPEIAPTRKGILVKNIDLSMPTVLKGHWAVGHLTSRGYGSIRTPFAFRSATSVRSAEPEEAVHA